jgi:hypothetical protein
VRNMMHAMRDPLFSRGGMARYAITVHMLGTLLLTVSPSAAQDRGHTAATAAEPCAGNNGGITLPPGFCATVFADNIGHARQMVVAPNGAVYVNTWSGRYYRNDTPPAGGFLVALQDTSGDGRADVVVRFGPGAETGNGGGTGIALYNGGLFTVRKRQRLIRSQKSSSPSRLMRRARCRSKKRQRK